MTRRELRLWGDPDGDGPASVRLQQLLASATAAGWECSVSPPAGGPPGRDLAAAPSPVREALHRPVAATAPVLVCGGADAVTLATLAWPAASLVLAAADGDPTAALATVARHLAGWPQVDPGLALPREQLAGLAALPAPTSGLPVLHPALPDPVAAGTDIAVRAAARAGLDVLVVLLPARDAAGERALIELARAAAGGGEALDLRFVAGGLTADRLAAASAVLLPLRGAPTAEVVLPALASGRPVLMSSWEATAPVIGRPGVCLPIGGRRRGQEFEPDAHAAAAALVDLTARPSAAEATARRARQHVLEHHCAAVPAPALWAAASRSRLPRVVLEAPLLELSSTAVLTMATARALHRRGRVEVHLVPTAPFAEDLTWLRQRAPELAPLLTREPPAADLWLRAGWPPRAGSPRGVAPGGDAVRLDWEYGALPAELSPRITQEADLVVVHSRAVELMLRAAGRPAAGILRVPHGVDGAIFHEDAAPSEEVRRFAAGRPTLLFVGGLIWRKGLDLLLAALLRRPAGQMPALVVKAMGSDSSYAGFHLGELLRKVQRQRGAPDVLVLEDDLSPAELAGVYTASDLLVHPYRGEGFGMPVLEARACGLPVVVTAGGSTDDFCTGPGCVGVQAARRPLDLPGAHLGRPWVLEPDSEHLQAVLTTALGSLPELRTAARTAAAAVRSDHSWDNAAAALERVACSVRSSTRGRRPLPASPAPEPWNVEVR